MKTRLLLLISITLTCLFAFAEKDMCVKKHDGEILKFDVEDVSEVYYETIDDSSYVMSPYSDSTVVDTSDIKLRKGDNGR